MRKINDMKQQGLFYNKAGKVTHIHSFILTSLKTFWVQCGFQWQVVGILKGGKDERQPG